MRMTFHVKELDLQSDSLVMSGYLQLVLLLAQPCHIHAGDFSTDILIPMTNCQPRSGAVSDI